MSKALEEITKAVDKLRVEHDDPEMAHLDEDGLREDALKYIAEGAPDAVAIAAKALETESIDFPRWYA